MIIQDWDNDIQYEVREVTMRELLDSFVEKVQARADEYYQDRYPSLMSPRIDVIEGKTYWKVVKQGRKKTYYPDSRSYGEPLLDEEFNRSVFCFVNKETGDIYFPASWEAPSKKNPRGNLKSPENGMEAVDYNGTNIRYLR